MFIDKKDLLELAEAGYQITVINNAKTVYIGCKFGGGSRKKKETTIDKTETVEVEVEVEKESDPSPFQRDQSPATETVKLNPKAEEAYKKLLTMEDELTENLEIFNQSFFSDEKNKELLDKILSTDNADKVDEILSNWIKTIDFD
jgi:hypothetical protein